MSEYRRAYIEGGTFFFTVVTYLKQRVFDNEPAIELLKKSFRYAEARLPFVVKAMVIMPDHLHCIWTLPDNDSDFSTRWRLLKTDFSRRYCNGKASLPESRENRKEVTVWQRRFWEHVIRDQEDFNRHCDYIHYNPVKHGLVRTPIDWRHSSFKTFVEKGIYPPDWGGNVGEVLLKMNLE